MKTLVSAIAVTAIAGSAFGLADTIDRTNYPIYDENNLPDFVSIEKFELDARVDSRVGTPIFDGMGSDDGFGSGYLASPLGTGTLGIEDYVTSLGDGASDGVDGTGNSTFSLIEFGFVGGAEDLADPTGNTGGILFVDSFFTDFSLAGGFGLSLAQGGNFIYTITINDPANTQFANEGLLVLTANTDPAIGPVSGGQWFLSDKVAEAGAHGQFAETAITGAKTFDYGAGPVPINYISRLNVPTPGAAALFGIAGLAGIRRRR
jgi:hypothetical protein